MNFELSTRNKILLLIGAPTSLLLAYWLLRDRDEDEDEEDEETEKKMATSRQTVIEIKVPPKAVGAVIGRQGASIKEIQQTSGARVNFRDDNRDPEQDRTVIIRGSPEAAQEAENMIRKIIAEIPDIFTEEMTVPGNCLGRIIGRNGDTIRQMSRTSRAKVYVDRTRDDYHDTERIVTITGTKEQIDLAKSMIQEKVDDEAKFRAKKAVMEANREQRQKQRNQPQEHSQQHVTNGHYEKSNGTVGEPMKLTEHPAVRGWPEGRDYIEVYMSAVANPGLFWVQTLSSASVELDKMVDRITSFYSSESSKDYTLSNPEVGELVAAPFEGDQSWYRAKVMGIEGDTVDLYYVDYGDSGYLPCNQIRKLRSEFLQFPFQAIECHLAHVRPVGETWSEESVDIFDELTYAAKWKVLMAKKVGQHVTSTGTCPVLELVDTNKETDVNIAQEMVKQGHAVWEDND